MFIKRFSLLLIVLVALGTWLPPMGVQADEMPRSGFLTDETYAKLGPDPDKRVDWVYANPEAKIGNYNKIMMDYVQFVFNDDEGYKGIQADELTVLADAFHRAMIGQLSDQFEFTPTPGAGVLRLRVALTNVKASNPALGTVTSVIPVGLAVSVVKKGITGSHIGVGEASFEAELLDTETGEVIGAAIDRHEGEKYKIGKTVSKWGHVKDVFDYWAKSLKTRLEDVSKKE